MVLKCKTRVYTNNQGKYFFYLAKAIAEDSQFPFKIDEELELEVKGDKIIIQKK